MSVCSFIARDKKIMIIEDNCITLNQLRDFLDEYGYRTIPCKHPLEAMDLLNEITPDLIVLDIIMPDVDGYEFCKWVRSQTRLKMIPIVFLTAKTRLEDKLEGLGIGGDDYITKPFSMEELLARIEVILKRLESFHEISMRDELTHAFNRRYFNERLGEEVHRVKRTGRPFSAVLIDIDYFKRINDNYGHYVGDSVLIQFVKLLQSSLRKSDLVVRLGGEEFILLLSDTSSGKAYLLAERLRQTLDEVTFTYNENGVCAEIRMTISAGIACCPEHGEDAEALLALADKALYSAKSSGRNAVKIAIGK